jgi:transketolase
VNLIGVGAGYSYVVSGPTHQCYEDLTIMRALPNFRLYSPSDHITAAALFDDCLGLNGPKYLRLDAQVLPALYINRAPDVRRGFEIHRVGGEVCLLATGFMVHTALQVAERMAEAGSEVGVIDIFDITGFDEASLLAALKRYRGIVTMEEGFRGRGGLDAMMFNLAVNREGLAPILNIGVEGTYSFELGTRAELHEQVGIGVNTVFKSVSRFIDRISTKIHKTGQES